MRVEALEHAAAARIPRREHNGAAIEIAPRGVPRTVWTEHRPHAGFELRSQFAVGEERGAKAEIRGERRLPRRCRFRTTRPSERLQQLARRWCNADVGGAPRWVPAVELAAWMDARRQHDVSTHALDVDPGASTLLATRLISKTWLPPPPVSARTVCGNGPNLRTSSSRSPPLRGSTSTAKASNPLKQSARPMFASEQCSHHERTRSESVVASRQP